MNLQHLKTFVTVVEAGSFSAAARALGVSQPAVTMQIQSLEQALGTTLLDRRYRRVDLTEAGTLLLPVARRVLDEIDNAAAEVAALSGEVSGQLVIAASTTPGVYLVPRILGEFIAEHPQVNITVCVGSSAKVVGLVVSGEANIGVTGAWLRNSPVTFDQLANDELVAIAPLDSPLAGKHSTLAELAEQPFVMRELGSGTRQMAESALREHGVDPEDLHVILELGTGEAIVSAVEGGMGVSIVSRLVAAKALELNTIALLDVDGLPALRPFFAVVPRGTLTRAAEAFLGLLRARLAK